MIEPENIKAFFESDHERLDQLFMNYLNLKNGSHSRAQEYFVQFKYGLQRHMQWEEEIVFPLFEDKTDMDGTLRVMRMEHRKIRELLEVLHEKVKKADPNSDAEEYKLLTLIGEHSLKEEMIFYPTIERMLTDKDIAEIFEAMGIIPEATDKPA
jgi:regulator of cell morphogenesis and NO signaling